MSLFFATKSTSFLVNSKFEAIIYIIRRQKKKLIIKVYMQWLYILLCAFYGNYYVYLCAFYSDERIFICCKCIYSHDAFL